MPGPGRVRVLCKIEFIVNVFVHVTPMSIMNKQKSNTTFNLSLVIEYEGLGMLIGGRSHTH